MPRFWGVWATINWQSQHGVPALISVRGYGCAERVAGGAEQLPDGPEPARLGSSGWARAARPPDACGHGGRDELLGYLRRPPVPAAPLLLTVLPRVRPQLGSAVAALAHRRHLRRVASGLRTLHPVRGKGWCSPVAGIRRRRVLGPTRGPAGDFWILDAVPSSGRTVLPNKFCSGTLYHSGQLPYSATEHTPFSSITPPRVPVPTDSKPDRCFCLLDRARVDTEGALFFSLISASQGHLN